MRITNRAFGGERPKIDPRNLNENEAVLALDCELTSTGIRALRSNAFVDRVGVNAKTIYFYEDTWVGFEKFVDVVESPAGVTARRLYWTGDMFPRQATVEQLALGLSTRIGIPTPAKPSIGAITGDPLDDDNTDFTSFYTVAFVNQYGEEGDMSLPSNTFNFELGQSINVGNLGSVPQNFADLTDYSSVAAYRLYRFDPDADASRFVVEQLISQTSFKDNTGETVLGESFVTQDFVPPPADLQGLHLMSNGSAVGFVGKTVYITEPGQLNAWPYNFASQSDIVALSSFDNTLVVLTTGYPEVASFYDPQTISPSILTNREPCVSKESVVQASGGVIYATPSNLYFIGSSGGQSLTDGFYSDREFTRLKPETFHAAFRDGEYYAFHDGDAAGRCIVVDTREPNAVIRQLTQNADAVHVKRGTDELYLSIGTNIALFQGGTDRLQYTWQSKEHGLSSPAAIISARVLSEDFARRLPQAEIDRLNNRRTAIQDANRQALNARAVLSIANGYGGAIGQDTLCGAGFFAVPGLSNVFHPTGVAIANGVDIRAPAAAKEFIVTVGIYGDGELVDTTDVDTELVYRVTYSDRHRRWWYQLVGDVDIQQFDMAGSSSELHDGS